MMLFLFIYIISLLSVASANVEKTIFIAPSAVTLPAKDSTFDDLGLERLSPSNGMLRTQLNASFPIDSKSQGTDSWYFLENLNPGQRYEVRICWLATQPTEFTLSTYTLPEIMEDRALLSAISLYSSSQLATSPPQAATTPIRRGRRSAVADSEPSADSVLFLRISAAADYFSLDQTLMENVPPVLADVILDPFLGNVFPKSLVPTACWISVVACLGIVVARWISREFTRVVNSADIRDPQDVKKDQ